MRNCSLPLYLAWSDIRQRYRRSSLGPFWITISTAVMISCIGLIFGGLFKAPMVEFLPFLTAGLILWGFVSTTIIDATTVFVASESVIKQLPIPIFTHVIRIVARNFYIFLHNLVIFPFVLFIVGCPLTTVSLCSLVGLTILIINLLWISLLLGIICTRFRDLTQIVASVLQIFFYITPIIWLPSLLTSRASVMLLEPNPFYHLIELVRAPLLGRFPSLNNWSITILIAVIGWIFTISIFGKYRKRIAYWL